MNKTYELHYIDWKGRKKLVYLVANSYQEALESAKVLQGLEEIISIEEE